MCNTRSEVYLQSMKTYILSVNTLMWNLTSERHDNCAPCLGLILPIRWVTPPPTVLFEVFHSWRYICYVFTFGLASISTCQTLKDYRIHMKQVPLYCDNESAIKIANNPVQHSKTKHIEIRHHFLRDHVVKEDIDIIHVNTEEQLADIFTKPLDEKRFCKLRCELNILESSNVL